LVLQARLGLGAPVTAREPRGWMRWFDGGARLARDGGADDDHGTTGDPPAAGAPTPPRPPVAPARSLVGMTGTALSDLRPSGIAEIDGERVDVVTSGELLRRGEAIEVVRDEGYRRVVRRTTR
jgi:hypothetical protein